MRQLDYTDFKYLSSDKNVGFMARSFPSFIFYLKFMGIIQRAAVIAKRGEYDAAAWNASSFEVLDQLENIGVKIEVTNPQVVEKVGGACVFIGNHMSMMETLLLPGILLPLKQVTFVVKQDLLEYPVFQHIMRATDPIAVTRTNPRQDLKTVMSEGMEKLKSGCSVIVFPQTTRAHDFDPAQMSTIGVKLAKKAGVPVVPVALKTDTWTNGKLLKDFGRFDLTRTSHFTFGEPFMVEGKGSEEHDAVNNFIVEKLKAWSVPLISS